VVRSIIMVAALLALMLYCAAFLMWNQGARADVITFQLGGPPMWIGDVPIGFLPLIGAMVGATIMAIAAWAPWATQRVAVKAANAKLDRAIEKFNEQKARLQARDETIANLQSEIDDLQAAVAATEAPPADTPESLATMTDDLLLEEEDEDEDGV